MDPLGLQMSMRAVPPHYDCQESLEDLHTSVAACAGITRARMVMKDFRVFGDGGLRVHASWRENGLRFQVVSEG